MKMPYRIFPACLFLIAACLLGQVDAGLLTVTSLGDSGPGTLRDQIAAAAPGDTIQFAVTGSIEVDSSPLSIGKDLTISGPGAGILTIGPARKITSFFNISGGSVSISGLALKGGYGTQVSHQEIDPNTGLPTTITLLYGGAIYMTGGALTLSADTISGNRAYNGGGIYLSGGSIAMEGCILSGNQALGTYSGGGACIEGGSLSLTNCTISDNTAAYGAGISLISGSLTVSGSTFTGSIAQYGTDNVSGRGGGIFIGSGTATVVNSTFSGNKAGGLTGLQGQWGGGGISNSGTLTVANCTITGNTGPDGGGIRNDATLNLSNTIVAGNTATVTRSGGASADLYGTVASGDYNLVGNTSYATLAGTHNITGQSALLAPLGNYGGPTQTFRPLPGSPALDAGDPAFDASSLPYDQRGPGFPRIKNGRLCIGAYESEVMQSGSTIVVNTLDDHDDGIPGPTDCTLREAVNYAPAGATITFGVTGVITLTQGDLIVAKNLNIQGPANAPGVTVSGNNQSRIFTITAGPTAISNLTVTGGNGASSSTDHQNVNGAGGALFVFIKTPAVSASVSNCTFTGNTSNSPGNGGGAIRNGGVLAVTNCTFTGNDSGVTGGGGAIRSGGTLTVVNCTIAGNTCGGTLGGGGIYSVGTLNVSNSIVAGNTSATGPDISGTVASGDYNLVGNSSGATLTSGTHNITDQAALLGPLAGNGGSTQTLALLPGSPAIDAGSTALIPSGVTTDQRGSSRVVGSAVDIGALELDPTPLTVTIDQAASQTDPTISTPVHFTVVFNKPVSDFTADNLTLGGSAGATTATVSGSGTTYDVAVTGMAGSGTVTAVVAPGFVHDAVGNANQASTSTDHSVSYLSGDTVRHSGTIRALGDGSLAVGFLGNPSQTYTIQYATDLSDWQTLRTQTADSSGAISITDIPPAGSPRRFYRMLLP